MQGSLSFVAYEDPGRLIVFAGDTQARWVSTATMTDYNTVAAGDRFGNLFVNRLDPSISDKVDDDTSGQMIIQAKGLLNGAPHKTKLIAHFHVGDLIMSIKKTSLVPGGREVLLYTGLHGTIGAMIPLVSKDDIDFLTSLEAGAAYAGREDQYLYSS
ncbi:Cleavage/polyadenylation specificity factor, A subunit [Mycena floridula]|nr:Cleavage/polyadenylation specificity factor, A subunit [Mycena floridula]